MKQHPRPSPRRRPAQPRDHAKAAALVRLLAALVVEDYVAEQRKGES